MANVEGPQPKIDGSRRGEAAELPSSEDDPYATIGRDAPIGPAAGPDFAQQGPAALPELELPDYEILAEVGRGGMGVVYKAVHVRLNRICALKMILAGDVAGPETILRFLSEAEMVARLHHPHIIEIHRLGFHEGRPYFELEYAEGGSLARRIDGTPWPERRAAEFLEPVARAVAEAHRLGIVHRDLKPGNILLRADGAPKVSDFGMAKRLNVDSGLTRTNAVLGTPNYMAPEQALGHAREVGPATDVHALGAILYELLTGRPPFKAETPLETLDLVRTLEPLPPDRLRPNLSRDLQTICLKCLQKGPRQRYAGAAELAEDLRNFLDRKPIQARPIGAAERSWRWVRRNPRAAGLIAGTVLALVLGTAVSTYFAIAAGRSAARARIQSRRATEAAERAILEARRADQEMRRANAEAAAAHEISGFLVGLFEDVDPLAPQGRSFRIQHRPGDTITAREIVDRGEIMLRNQLRDRPLVRATLLETLGSVFVGLGELDKAERLIAEALEFRRSKLPTGRLDLAACLHVLGYVKQVQSDPSCLGLFREALAIRLELLGTDDPLTAATMFHLGLALLQTEADRGGEAERLMEQSLAVRHRCLGDRSPVVAHQLLVMGFLRAERGALVRAASNFLEAAVVLNRIEDGRAASLVLALFARASLMDTLFGVKRAVPYYVQFQNKAQALLGHDHHIVTYANKLFADRLAAAGAYAEAERFYRKAIADCRLLGGRAGELGALKVGLALCLKKEGDAAHAERELDEAAAILETGPRTPRVLKNLSRAYRMRAGLLAKRGEQQQSQELAHKADAVDRELKGR